MPMKLQDQHLKGLNSRKHPLTKQPQLSQSHILPFQKDAKAGKPTQTSHFILTYFKTAFFKSHLKKKQNKNFFCWWYQLLTNFFGKGANWLDLSKSRKPILKFPGKTTNTYLRNSKAQFVTMLLSLSFLFPCLLTKSRQKIWKLLSVYGLRETELLANKSQLLSFCPPWETRATQISGNQYLIVSDALEIILRRQR